MLASVRVCCSAGSAALKEAWAGEVLITLHIPPRGHNGVRSCITCLKSSVSLPLCPALGGGGQHGVPNVSHQDTLIFLQPHR